MKKSLRAFGVGVFLVGAIYSFSNVSNSSSPSSSDISQYKKEIAVLENQLATAKAEIEQLKNNEKDASTTSEMEQTSEKNENPSNVQANDKNVVTGTIYIYEGMSIYDIGKQVEDTGVVTNGRELELFLSKPEYSRAIQKGQFELDSSMTIEHMARIITGKKIEN